MTIFSDQGSIAVGSVLTEACSVAVATTAIRFKGGATGLVSTGKRCEFCAAHLAASPLSGLLVLYSWYAIMRPMRMIRSSSPSDAAQKSPIQTIESSKLG